MHQQYLRDEDGRAVEVPERALEPEHPRFGGEELRIEAARHLGVVQELPGIEAVERFIEADPEQATPAAFR